MADFQTDGRLSGKRFAQQFPCPAHQQIFIRERISQAHEKYPHKKQPLVKYNYFNFNGMFGVMIVMLSGILIGYILRNIRAIPALVSKINIYIIFLLLFVMGLSVGSNPQVIQGLGTLGLLGIAISVVSIAGSVFLSWIVYRHLFKKEDDQRS